MHANFPNSLTPPHSVMDLYNKTQANYFYAQIDTPTSCSFFGPVVSFIIRLIIEIKNALIKTVSWISMIKEPINLRIVGGILVFIIVKVFYRLFDKMTSLLHTLLARNFM